MSKTEYDLNRIDALLEATAPLVGEGPAVMEPFRIFGEIAIVASTGPIQAEILRAEEPVVTDEEIANAIGQRVFDRLGPEEGRKLYAFCNDEVDEDEGPKLNRDGATVMADIKTVLEPTDTKEQILKDKNELADRESMIADKLKAVDLSTRAKVNGKLFSVAQGESPVASIFSSGPDSMFGAKHQVVSVQRQAAEGELAKLGLWQPGTSEILTKEHSEKYYEWERLGQGQFQNGEIAIIRRSITDPEDKYLDADAGKWLPGEVHEYLAVKVGALKGELTGADNINNTTAEMILKLVRDIAKDGPDDSLPAEVKSPAQTALKAATRLLPAEIRDWATETAEKYFGISLSN